MEYQYKIMRILLVIPTLKQGGAERVMSELANQWSVMGHEVHLALLATHTPFYEVSDSIYTHNLGFINKNRIQKHFSEFKTLLCLRKLVKTIRPDFVLSFMEKYNILTIISTRLLNVPVFVSDRSNPRIKRSIILGSLRKIFYIFASGLIAQTSLAKELATTETNHKNIFVLPNPVKDICLTEITCKKNIILNVGRLVPEKGQRYLIEAFSKLDAPNWFLYILGDGPLRKELEQQIDQLGLNDCVVLPGSISDIDTYLSEASIYAFPSISEGFPNALCEAMAAGLPCISFDCDAGPRDLITDGQNGILIPVGDVELLSIKLRDLITDEVMRKKIGNAAKLVGKRLNKKVVAIEWIDKITKKP